MELEGTGWDEGEGVEKMWIEQSCMKFSKAFI